MVKIVTEKREIGPTLQKSHILEILITGIRLLRILIQVKVNFCCSNLIFERLLDPRPHCQYGLLCYQRDPKHVFTFQHSKFADRRKRRAAKKAKLEDLSSSGKKIQKKISKKFFASKFLPQNEVIPMPNSKLLIRTLTSIFPTMRRQTLLTRKSTLLTPQSVNSCVKLKIYYEKMYSEHQKLTENFSKFFF